jgi:hypothetical protein
MGKMRQAPIVGGAYADDSRPWSVQDCQNLLPQAAETEGTRSRMILRPVPGLQEFATYPNVTRDRGGYVAEGQLFVVKGEALIQVNTNGSLTIRGTIPGRGRCSFAHNGVNELLITTGSSGYIYDWAAETLTQITDDGYPGAILAEYIANLFVQIEPGRRYAFNSALNDGSDYNALETFQGESKPDRIVSHAVVNGEYVLLNERSMDHFAYTGTTNALFENKLIPIDRGCASRFGVCKLDNGLYFIGDDGNGYEKRGYQLRRITTHAIEQAWAACDLSKAFCFRFEDRGHKIWYVTFPDGHTWGYDIAASAAMGKPVWHRRKSQGMDRWRLSWLDKWNGRWYGGEYNSGRIFRLDWDYHLEGCDRIHWKRTSGVLHNAQNRVALHGFEVVVDAAGEASACASVETLVFDPEQYTVSTLTIGGGLPDAAVGDAANFRYATIGGVSPITFAVTAGALPAGTTMDSLGNITGTCTTAEHDNAWTVTATDAEGNTATQVEAQYVLDMVGDFEDGVTGTAYSDSVAGSEGEAPYTFSKTTGTLPTSLTLSSAGVLSGTPTVAGTYNFSVQIVDDEGVDQTKAYEVVIRNLATWMAAGSALTTSPDVLTWTARTTGLTPGFALRGLAYGEGLYIAVGDNASGTHYIITSPDGVTWTTRTSAITCDTLRGVAYGAGVFVIVGSSGGATDGKIQSSPDGITWTEQSAVATIGPLMDVTFGAGMFVAVAENTGKITYSADGTNWTNVTVGGSPTAITYANGMFMAVGGAGSTVTSANGIVWATRTGVLSFGALDSIAGGNSVWVAGSNNGSADNGIWRSTNDGDTWTKVYVGGFYPSVAYGDGIFLCGANAGDGRYSTDDGVTWTTTTIHPTSIDTYTLLYRG